MSVVLELLYWLMILAGILLATGAMLSASAERVLKRRGQLPPVRVPDNDNEVRMPFHDETADPEHGRGLR